MVPRSSLLTLAVIVVCFASLGATWVTPGKGYHAAAASGPTFIQEAETSGWDTATASINSASFAVQVGDVLVACSVVENWGTSQENVTVTNSGTSLTWTVQERLAIQDYCAVQIATATATAAESITVNFAKATSTYRMGGNVLTFRNSSGLGAAEIGNATAAPSLAVTTTAANSAIVTVAGDWNAGDGASRTWRTINSITPTSGNSLELTYFRNSSAYTVYIGYWNDVGATGSKTTGLSAPSMKYGIASIEVKGP